MNNLSAFLIIFLISSTASGDIRTSNTYYTGGGTAHANVALHNIDYTNKVQIFSDSLIGESKGESANDADLSWFEDQSTIDSSDGKIGTNLEVRAIGAEYTKNLVAGSKDTITSSYNAEDGHAKTSCFNQVTLVKEDIILENNKYHANLVASPSGIYTKGNGESGEDGTSSFAHETYLTHMDKWCNIKSNLVCSEVRSGDIPVRYTWDTFAYSNENYAADGLNIKADDGNRDVRFIIIGSSSELSDKHAGPVHLRPIKHTWFRESDEIYMNYKLVGWH